MTPVRMAVSMFGLPGLYDDEPSGSVRTAQLAEELGYYQVVFQDHVCMGENTDRYPFGEFPLPPSAPWLEPMVMMSAVAAATDTIRIASGVIISPLRPTTLLAKMAATLDQLSNGRLDLGVGVGWQQEEYEAQGLEFSERWGLFDDQLRACRLLWREYPVTVASRQVNLNRIYSTPFPRQRELPLWFGVAATERQARRIAELGQGWLPITQDPDELARGIACMHRGLQAAGRDPQTLEVRAIIKPVAKAGRPDLQASLQQARELAAAGATILELVPLHFAASAEALREVLSEAAAWAQAAE